MYIFTDWKNVSDDVELIARGSTVNMGKGRIVANACHIGRTLFMNITLAVADDTHVPEDDAQWVLSLHPDLCPSYEAYVAGIRTVIPTLYYSADAIIHGAAFWQNDGIVLYADGYAVTAKHPFPEGTPYAAYMTGFWETDVED